MFRTSPNKKDVKCEMKTAFVYLPDGARERIANGTMPIDEYRRVMATSAWGGDPEVAKSMQTMHFENNPKTIGPDTMVITKLKK